MTRTIVVGIDAALFSGLDTTAAILPRETTSDKTFRDRAPGSPGLPKHDGACIAANKLNGIRAALAHDTYSAHQAVEHDDANVLCMGARIIGASLAQEIVLAWARANFSGDERHQRRLDKVLAIEASANGTEGTTT